jgi:hypothetical protein
MLILLSLILWSWILWNTQKYSNRFVPYLQRGGGGGDTTVTSHTYYYYKIKFAHNSIDPSQTIIFYDAFGVEIYILPPYYEFMNYATGILSVPGTTQNFTVERVATASYYVYYSSDDVIIDYDNAEFHIAKKLIKVPATSVIKATFEYLTVITAFKGIASVIDGRWDTQVQTEFFAEPPTNYNYAILDLGSIRTIQALDIVAGFYKPDDIRKFDINFNISLEYSLDGVDYYNISDKTFNVAFTGGESKSFEEEDLGVGFQTRYIKVLLEKVQKINYGDITVTVSEVNRQNLIDRGIIDTNLANGSIAVLKYGVWVVAFTEIGAYENIVLKSESKLIPTTYLSSNIDLGVLPSGSYPTIVNVDSTDGFELLSAETSRNAYIKNTDGTFDIFTYTGTTSTSFTGVSGLSFNHNIDAMVVQELENDTDIYDYDCLLPKLKDRLYKSSKIDDKTLYSEAQINYVSREFLKEFVKNHSKISVDLLYSPHIQVGQTIEVIDSYNGTNTNYFVDSIEDNNGYYRLTLARYPGG